MEEPDQVVSGQRASLSKTATDILKPWAERREAIAGLMELATTTELEARRSAIDYVEGAEPAAVATPSVGPVWQFWAQGLGEAPPIVATCIGSVGKNRAGREHIVLTAETIGSYVKFTPEMQSRITFWGWTKTADLLRLLLLEKYGGTWVDATVYLGGPLPNYVTAEPFFVFRRRYTPGILASWLIHSQQGHPLVSAWRVAYQRYLMSADEPTDYFMLHFIFEALLLSSNELLSRWHQVPDIFAAVASELKNIWDEPFDLARLNAILERCPIQKLTYKGFRRAPLGGGTFRQYLAQGQRLFG